MQVTITEVYTDEGVWVESDTATYLLSEEEEIRKLAYACGIDPENEEILLNLLSEEHVGRTVDIEPRFLTL